VGLQGNRILFSLAELTIGWLLVRQAEVAATCLQQAPDHDRAFYQGKIAIADFYSAEVLPGLTLARKQVESSSLTVMELPNDSF
jgi:hypothetical protein